MPTLLAQMTWHDSGEHMDAGWWWAMGLGWLALLALVAILGIVVVRSLAHRSPTVAGHAPLHTLADRFARGEIDEQEYQRRREVLRTG